jgi:hypothetical protein
VQLANAIDAGDLGTAAALAEKAEALALTHQWTHLVVAVRYCLACGHLAHSPATRAVAGFRAAEDAARRMEETQPEVAQGLRIKCRLGMGAAALKAGAFGQAAALYGDTAALARGVEDTSMELECHRMAAYCHEQAGALAQAWDEGLAALAVGARLRPAEREASTLSYAAAGLLRLTKRRGYRPRRVPVEREIHRLLGPQWHPSAP